jgi:HK97 family phage prohead protease
MRLHPKIEERKQSALPINYNFQPVVNLETRESLLNQRIIEGYGNVWNSSNSHGEKFMKGCWTRSINENGPMSDAHYKIKFRNQHGNALALIDVLREDEVGLYFKTKPLDDIDEADNLLKQVRSGTINNFSNGFKYIWDKMEYDSEDDSLIIKEARLFEISAVPIPSDLNTFAMRSLGWGEPLDTDELEDFIQDLPKNKQLQCRKLISKCLSQPKPPSIIERAHQEDAEQQESLYSYLLKNIK